LQENISAEIFTGGDVTRRSKFLWKAILERSGHFLTLCMIGTVSFVVVVWITTAISIEMFVADVM
jgi:hypothetical protein